MKPFKPYQIVLIPVLFVIAVSLLWRACAPAQSARAETRHAHPLWSQRGQVVNLPLTNIASPLTIASGAALTFTRVHDATHTASYTHPYTGYITTAATNVLRIESYGALFEDTRTNYMLWYDQFDHAGWSNVELHPFGSGSVANARLGPDGTQSMDLIVETSANNYHVIYQGMAGVADGSTVTGSVYAYPKERTWLLHIHNTSGGLKHAWFDVANGVVGAAEAGVTSGIEAGPAGTYRCWSSVAVGVISGGYQFFTGGVPANSTTTFAGDNTSGIYVWGAQVEVGAFPSTVIPTAGTTMIRNPDVLSFVNANLIPAAAGTVAADVRVQRTGAFNDVFGSNGAIQPLGKSNNDKTFVYDGTTVLEGPDFSANANHRIAVHWGATKMNTAIDGTLGTEGAFDGTMIATPATDTIVLGSNSGAGNFFWGWIKNFRVWNRKLTDSELSAVTK